MKGGDRRAGVGTNGVGEDQSHHASTMANIEIRYLILIMSLAKEVMPFMKAVPSHWSLRGTSFEE